MADTQDFGSDCIDLRWWQHASPVTADCKRLMKIAMDNFMHSGDETNPFLEYGFQRDTTGFVPFRKSLAEFLTRQYNNAVDMDSLAVTYGASHGLEIILSLVLRENDPLFFQQPSFATSLGQCKDTQKKIIPIEADEHGVLPEDFEKKLVEHFGHKENFADDKKQEAFSIDSFGRGARIYDGGAYLIPNFCNPTGSCLAIDRCKKIISLARKYNILLICDDVYNMISYETNDDGEFKDIHPRLYQFDSKDDVDYGKGHVVSIGTFSKIFFPSIRLGWLELPPLLYEYIKRISFIYGSGGIALFQSAIIKCLLDDKTMDEHLLFTRKFYQEQTVIFNAALGKYLPSEVEYYAPKGGFSFWLSLPKHIDSQELLDICLENHKIAFLRGELFSAARGSCKNCFRLAISVCDNNNLESVAKSLAEDIDILLGKYKDCKASITS